MPVVTAEMRLDLLEYRRGRGAGNTDRPLTHSLDYGKGVRMSNSMSIKGRAGSDGELRFAPSGVAACSFSVADTPRKKDESGQWIDAGPTLWQRVQVWGPEAEKAAEEVRKGSLVTVSGRVKAEEWQDKQTGETRKSTTLVADVVYVHPPKESQGGQQRQQQAQPDPWGSQPQGGGFGDQNDPTPF